ncbi:hypothetical protein PENTCL1PPCAC_5970 [Pristionchus entomophagus]|uniref:Amino acid permease/ SLC12A domain-containing protein n=1 Tax=Pristionchus entomophagus TaxID=358040 RepID=A0AAV5SLH5_9BILA|nr:hypothetical protein PENTCL1PPCAC_5970 [Pristionchus entomophagus]
MEGAAGSSSRDPPDSLYAAEQRTRLDADVPWWQRNLLMNQPVLFGTWDGVFTTVMVNIFGIIVFLRMGWIVGTAGVANAILLLGICTALAVITVFSAIGIVERCRIQSGGIYFLVSHVLGGQIGGAVGLIYGFGQAVATGLVAVGFGESVAHYFNTESRVVIKVSAIAVILVLTAINTAGLSWVIRLQLILLSCLALAACDFILGSLWTVDLEHGVGHFSAARLRANAEPHYGEMNCSKLGIDLIQPKSSFFTVFGVFFANFLGVLAGVNMSGDLKEPHKSIPMGELSAVTVSSSVCFVFIMILGAVVDRDWLLCDHLIQERVSLTGFLFMTGLYICSLSSIIGSLLGTPRVLQGIAAEGIIPILNPLAQGHGANRNPVLAGVVMMGVACVFVLLGDLNMLAILSTMPFLITYAFVNYAYVSLAMSADLEDVTQAANGGPEPSASYGSMHQISENGDLDRLFPDERNAKPTTSSNMENGTTGIVEQQASWYSLFSNRYIAFVGCLVNLTILLLIHFWFAVIHFVAFAALYSYIGRVCPTCFPGISQFSFPHMFKTAFTSLEALGKTVTEPTASVAGPTPVDVTTSQLNDPNSDYSTRKGYHHAENVAADFD